MTNHEKMIKAFNLGSDSRIAGRPRKSNPYLSGSLSWKYWKKGWLDVDKNWGSWATLWEVKPLPEIKE